jgi:hypothetical protein
MHFKQAPPYDLIPPTAPPSVVYWPHVLIDAPLQLTEEIEEASKSFKDLLMTFHTRMNQPAATRTQISVSTSTLEDEWNEFQLQIQSLQEELRESRKENKILQDKLNQEIEKCKEITILKDSYSTELLRFEASLTVTADQTIQPVSGKENLSSNAILNEGGSFSPSSEDSVARMAKQRKAIKEKSKMKYSKK